MNIGIDARQLSREMPAGVGIYLRKILLYLATIHDNNYFLYSNKKIHFNLEDHSNFHIRVINGRIGTLWVRYILPKYLCRDQINVFWGPEHILPKRIRGISYIVTIHDLALIINRHWGANMNSLIQNVFLKNSVNDADKVIAISQCTKNDLVELCKIDQEKIDIIYNGGFINISCELDEKAMGFTLKKYGIHTKYFLFIGTIEPRKNIELIIEGFEKYCEKNIDTKLVLVGKLGWKYKNILNKIKTSKVKDKIIYTGYVTVQEKKHLLLGAIAFIFPSYYEGFGLPIIEAMSLKVPVITNRKSSLKEVGGDAAFYMKSDNDNNELASLMEICERMTYKERNHVGELCIEQARKFTWEICAKKTYEEIINFNL